MFGGKKDKKEEGPLGEQPAAPEDLEGTAPIGDEVNGEIEKQAPPPAAPPPPVAGSTAGNSGGSHTKNQMILVAVGIVILILVVVAASVAIGFALSDHHDVAREPGGFMRHGGMMNRGGMMNGPGAGQFRQELNNLSGGGVVSIIRGNVGTVDGGNVTIQTPTGNETVVITDSTKFRGANLTDGKGSASSLTAGEQVTVFAKKTTDGKLEAVVVSVSAGNAPNK